MDKVASQVEPAAKDITRGVIRPGGEKLSKNAVPVTEEITRGRIEPAVDQVGVRLDYLDLTLRIITKLRLESKLMISLLSIIYGECSILQWANFCYAPFIEPNSSLSIAKCVPSDAA